MNEFFRLVGHQVGADLRALPRSIRRMVSGAARLERAVNIADLRNLAHKSLPTSIFDFVDGAAGDEVTARRNQSAFAERTLLPRVLSDVSRIDLGSTVLGQSIDVPLLAAPTGLTGLVHPSGEVGIARAAHAAGTVYMMSAMASYSIEELHKLAPGRNWFQLYVWRDRGLVRELIARARIADFQALVLTVDVPYGGARERDLRNGFGIPPRLTLRSMAQGVRRPRWSANFVRHPRIRVANAANTSRPDPISLTEYIAGQFDPSVSWDDVAWIRELWDRPLIVKGIMHPDDAARAVEAGADAIVVSNHGGRQLDGGSATIEALPAVLDSVGDRAEVYLDGGIRRGRDIVQALAMGARACMVGRPLVYGLGARGEAGASRALQILTDELRLAMALTGYSSIDALRGSLSQPDRSTQFLVPRAARATRLGTDREMNDPSSIELSASQLAPPEEHHAN